MPEPFPPIAAALRLIRTRRGLTQTALSKLEGAPDFRTLSHWETGRKVPSLLLLHKFLTALGLDFRDLQEAFDQLEGRVSGGLDSRLSAIERQAAETAQQLELAAQGLDGIERRVSEIEGAGEQLECLAGRVEKLERKPKRAPRKRSRKAKEPPREP